MKRALRSCKESANTIFKASVYISDIKFFFLFSGFLSDQTIEEVKGKGKTLKTRRYSKGPKVRQIERFFVAEKIGRVRLIGIFRGLDVRIGEVFIQ